MVFAVTFYSIFFIKYFVDVVYILYDNRKCVEISWMVLLNVLFLCSKNSFRC